MEAESLRNQFESEIAWRQEELAFLKNQLVNVDEKNKAKYRKALVLMLYAHFEGFSKIALQLYLQYINDLNLSIADVNANLQAAALKKEFIAFDNLDRKNEYFRKKLPNDTKLHRFYRRVDLIEQIDNFKNGKLRIDDDIIDTESNLWYVVLQKNMYVCGLPIDLFEQQKNDIDALVNRRNAIAHGDVKSGVSETEYEKWEKQTYSVMNKMIRTLFDYAYNNRFIVSRNN